MSQQEAWDKQVQEIQGTIARIEKQVLDRMEALEQLVRDQDALLQESFDTIEAEYGNGPKILYQILDLQQRAKDLLGDV